MSLKRHIKNTEAAIKEWATVDPGTVSHDHWLYREDGYPFSEPPSCGSPGWFGGHLPYFAHFAELGVRVGKDGIPFLKRRSNLTDEALSEYLFGSWGLFYGQSLREVGTGHEIVTARLRANLERLLALERNEGGQPRRIKNAS